MTTRVEYDQVAAVYDRRYERGAMSGIERALREATRATAACRVLEVGCGTGHWLRRCGAPEVMGADRSLGMLAKAAVKLSTGRSTAAEPSASAPEVATALLAADAHALPFASATFDVVAAIHALHHFGDPAHFLDCAARLLAPGGAVLVIGMDPAAGRDRWYLYDYFPETLPLDLDRYPSHVAIRHWMREAGLDRIQTRTAGRIQAVQRGRAVLDDPILHRFGTSQLTLIDQDAFDRGMARIREAVERDPDHSPFVTELTLPMTIGFRPS